MSLGKHLAGVVALGLAAFAAAEEVSDWRLDLLKAEGIPTETSSLQKLEKRFSVSNDLLSQAVSRLGSEKFAAREQAQREILLMGKDVLPLLQQGPQSEDPEVRQRLAAIQRTLEAGGRWAKEDLIRKAVTSLLRERLKPNGAIAEPPLFVELFRDPAPSLEKGYRRFRFEADPGLLGSVSDGTLRLNGNHAGDGDQRLRLDAKSLTGKESFPDTFRIEVKLGGEAKGAGTYHVGVSIGNVRALFHPAYQGGGFRFQRVDNQKQLTENSSMGFDPAAGKLQQMSLAVKRIPGGKVELEATIGNGDKVFTERKIFEESVIGKLDHLSLDRSGRNGGDGLFDDLIVDLGNH
ncbi:MAG: hypothetical protein CFE26_04235 [Verrucomicrobiales bacterium VVV1]|nr:MAG: hypothetical protein CFE26_04235 [Verrucomicrobiales bacterium VVV1]